jgi:hypothetical protein
MKVAITFSFRSVLSHAAERPRRPSEVTATAVTESVSYECAQAFPLQVPAVGMPLLSTSADLAPRLRALQPPRTRSSRVGIT